MTIKAIYENGVFKPREPVHLEEHTEVEVSIPAAVPLDIADPTGWKAAEALIGLIHDAPADMAEQHDGYLHAGPHRRQTPNRRRKVFEDDVLKNFEAWRRKRRAARRRR